MLSGTDVVAKTGEHRSQLGQWRTTQRLADPRLRAYVHGYFASSSRLHVAVRERHVPSPEVPLLLNFGAPHRRLDVEGSRGSTGHDGVWVVGLHDRHQLTRAAGEREFMVVRFTPLGAHLFLGLPMHLIANDAVDLALINPALARGLVSRIAAAGSWIERFAAMEALIAERLTGAEIPASIDFAWHRLVAADGRIAIGSLASDAGCSHRTLIARFQTWVGLPPKTVARLLRFNRVLRSLDQLSRTRPNERVSKPYIEITRADDQPVHAIPWADLAADCRYVDQAHLIKDFREFAGSTPNAFLRQLSCLS